MLATIRTISLLASFEYRGGTDIDRALTLLLGGLWHALEGLHDGEALSRPLAGRQA
jgi:hypothetical protein